MPNGNIIDLQWKDEYAMGVPSVDNAHMEIFQVAALLLETGLTRNETAIAETVSFLKNYVIRHFADEERLMQAWEFAGIERHIEEHNNFRDQTLPKIEKKLVESGYSQESIDEFVAILVDWLKNHIMTFDMVINVLRAI